MVHIKVRKYCGPVELIYDIIKCRHDSVGSWNGLICFPHIHIQPYFMIIAGPLRRYNHRDTQLVGFSTLSIMSSAWSFSESACSLGLTLNGILLWACAISVQSVRDQRANLPSLLSSFRYRGTDQRTLLTNFL